MTNFLVMCVTIVGKYIFHSSSTFWNSWKIIFWQLNYVSILLTVCYLSYRTCNLLLVTIPHGWISYSSQAPRLKSWKNTYPKDSDSFILTCRISEKRLHRQRPCYIWKCNSTSNATTQSPVQLYILVVYMHTNSVLR